MSVSFSDVYSRAVGLFDDPKITYAYETNKIRFAKLMWTFLQNAIGGLISPTEVAYWASNYTAPSGTMEVFIETIDSNTLEFQTTFSLDNDFEIIEGSMYQYTADGEIVNAYLDVTNREVTFPEPISEGAEFSIEQYFPGCFNNDYINTSNKTKETILQKVLGILAHRLVIAWGENERNYLLDIRNLMTDADFKVSSNSKALSAKNIWVNTLHTEIATLETQLGWLMRFPNASSKGN